MAVLFLTSDPEMIAPNLTHGTFFKVNESPFSACLRCADRQVFLATWKDIPNENEAQFQIKDCHLNSGEEEEEEEDVDAAECHLSMHQRGVYY